MHFLGAVIAEKQDDIYGILAEWSEYADVDEYVKETRSEIIANGRADDQAYLEDHGNDTDPMHEKFRRAAAGRLAPSTDAEVEAAADFFTSHLSMLGSASSFIDTGRAKDLARGMLDAARKAINRPATSQIQRTSMGLSGHMEYRHTMK